MNGDQRSVISDQKSEARSQKSEIRKCFLYFLLLTSGFLLFYSQPLFAKSKVKKPKAAPAKQAQTKKEELQAPISQDVIEALAKGSLNEAAIELREQHTSAKSLYLLREVTRIVMFETSKKKPKHSEAHQFYQNLGISYHNLFLFLKTNGYTQEKFAKEAIKFYKKSRGYATPMHKQETDILMAALFVSSGDEDKAEKIMSKIDMTKLGADFQTQEYLAAYYAAKGNEDAAVESLKAAYRERPDVIMTWLAVGDDFCLIKGDPKFVALLNDWHFAKSSKRLEFTIPESSAPKLQFAEPQVQFRHPTAPQAQPHYKMTKPHLKTHKKVAVTKKSSKTNKKAKKK